MGFEVLLVVLFIGLAVWAGRYHGAPWNLIAFVIGLPLFIALVFWLTS